MKKEKKNILRRSFIGCSCDKKKFWVESYRNEINLGSILNANWQLKYILQSKNYASGKLSHLSDNSYHKYVLQQNIYKYILEKRYNKKITSMNLLILHPNYENYLHGL